LKQGKRGFDYVVKHFEGAAVLAACRALADALVWRVRYFALSVV